MADQDVEQQQDQHEAPPPNGRADEEAGDDDREALRAELERLKSANGKLLNEKSKLLKTEAARKKVSEEMKGWITLQDELDVEPDQVRELLSKREAADDKQAHDKGDVEKLLANRDTKHQKDLAKKDNELRQREEVIARMRATIEALTVDAQLDAELSKFVEPALKKGAFALLRGKFKAIDDEEAPYGVQVVVDVDGDHMAPKDFVKAWAENDPDAQGYLIANQSRGGGAPATAGGKNNVPRLHRSKLTTKQKTEFIERFGFDRYNQLPM